MAVLKAPLHRWSAVQLASALDRRELSAATLAAALIERTVGLDPSLHAWVDFDPAGARRRARDVDRAAARGPMHGLPIGVKDIIDTAGIATAYGSPIYADHVPACDAACVALARAAGAWVLGKTVSTEFANMTPASTRNPHGLAHTPGGSSSGSAAAVAAGLVPLALGTQTAGSLIRPAAFCGIVAYKPSPRRIARAGVKANADSLDEVGVLARSVEDVALFARVLCGDVAINPPNPQAMVPRIGVTLTSQYAALSSDMIEMVGASTKRLAAAGARVVDAVWPRSFEALFEAQRTVQLFETVRALAPEHRYRREGLSPALIDFLDEGSRVSPATFAAAMATARTAIVALDTLFADCDVLITPAAPGAAPATLATTGDPTFNRPWQLLGCPSIALPGGVDGAGLPLGLQIVGRPQDDDRTFAAAAWIEHALQARSISMGRCLS